MVSCWSCQQFRRQTYSCADPTDLHPKPSQAFWKPAACGAHGELKPIIPVRFRSPEQDTASKHHWWQKSNSGPELSSLTEVLLASSADKKGVLSKSLSCLINSCIILSLIFKYKKTKLWDCIWKLVLLGVQLDMEHFLFSLLTNLKQM